MGEAIVGSVDLEKIAALKETAVKSWETNLEENPIGLVAMRGDDGKIIECIAPEIQSQESPRGDNWDIVYNGQRYPFSLSLISRLQTQSRALFEYDFMGTTSLRYVQSEEATFDFLTAIKPA